MKPLIVDPAPPAKARLGYACETVGKSRRVSLRAYVKILAQAAGLVW